MHFKHFNWFSLSLSCCPNMCCASTYERECIQDFHPLIHEGVCLHGDCNLNGSYELFSFVLIPIKWLGGLALQVGWCELLTGMLAWGFIKIAWTTVDARQHLGICTGRPDPCGSQVEVGRGCYELSQLLARHVLQDSKVFQKSQKSQMHIRKDMGFSSCAAPPLYHMSSYFQKSAKAETNWKGSKGRRTKVSGSGSKTEEWGLKHKVQVQGRARFSSGAMRGMSESHGQGKMSLIFELWKIQESEVRLYTL